MDFSSIKEYLKPDLDRVQDLMNTSLASDIELLDKTNQRVLAHSGKQVRPVLALLTAKACSGGFVTEETIHFAAAAELIHNATLLHDDVADNSPVRRGEPTVMSLLGGRASVLLGDYWLVKGIESVLSVNTFSGKVIRIFSNTLSDLAEGELLQLQKADTCDTTESDYYRIIYNKTASLFVASANTAAISVSASDEKRKAAKLYAECLGIAFQIKDEIPLPLLGAFVNAGEDMEKEIRALVARADEDADSRKKIVDFVRENGGVDYAIKSLGDYVGKAKAALRTMGTGKEVSMLADIADFVAYRKS